MFKSVRLLLLCAVFALPSWCASHADFNGTWKLRNVTWSEVYTFEHDGTWLRVFQRIDDDLGKRVLDVSGTLDGKVLTAHAIRAARRRAPLLTHAPALFAVLRSLRALRF